ncbi:hypothetical protein [Streptomyces sp. S1]|uniref:hypothetical protein n=1 Tax=Streptomyces sp. S1 TaxID=718288 RepID=UPI003D71639E
MAYYKALDSRTVLPVYVNYSKSISIEPEFRKTATALPFFRQWILAQVVRGAAATLMELKQEVPDDLAPHFATAQKLVSAVERRQLDKAPESDFDLTGVLEILDLCNKISGRRRTVLLLDDAAHAFSVEQQHEFFEVFGALRSRTVSAKAAVYPGVTSYTPRFHVGQDAQLTNVWLQPDAPNYIEMMRDIAKQRLSKEDFDRLSRREEIIDYLALASFGVPRAFLAMLAQVLEMDDRKMTSLRLADAAIDENATNALKVFRSLEDKLPRYKNFVSIGRQLVDSGIEAIREYNERRSAVDSMMGRATNLLLQEPVSAEIQKVLGFLEYAGVVRSMTGNISMGKVTYQVVVPHFSLLITRNSLGMGRNPKMSTAVELLNRRDSHVRVRRRVDSLLGSDYQSRCRLNLGACSNCRTERDNPEARFCSNCGTRLEQVSVFEELLDTPIEKLPISSILLERIRNSSDIRKVKDVLLDEERQVLLKVPYIGPVRASHIWGLAEEFVYE